MPSEYASWRALAEAHGSGQSDEQSIKRSYCEDLECRGGPPWVLHLPRTDEVSVSVHLVTLTEHSTLLVTPELFAMGKLMCQGSTDHELDADAIPPTVLISVHDQEHGEPYCDGPDDEVCDNPCHDEEWECIVQYDPTELVVALEDCESPI